MFVDYHVHSDYSDDSWYLMREVIEDAIKLGLKEIVFTEHVDYGVKEDWTEEDTYVVGGNQIVKNVHYPLYFQEIETLREEYADKIRIKVGLEFGMQAHTIEQYETLYASYPFDFILLSVHEVGDQEFWTGDFMRGRSEDECYQLYYDELHYLVDNYKHYSVLAHMDLVRRYLDKEVDRFDDYKDKIKAILEVVIADGKGIEINTSSHRYGVNGLTPSIEILKLYHELGGKIITLGSDSHKPEHLGAYLKDAAKILQEIGFEHYCTFDKMVPKFHRLADFG